MRFLDVSSVPDNLASRPKWPSRPLDQTTPAKRINPHKGISNVPAKWRVAASLSGWGEQAAQKRVDSENREATVEILAHPRLKC